MPDSITRIALDSWRLGLRAITAMPRLSGTAFLSLLVCQITIDYFFTDPESGISSGFASFLVNVLRTVIVASVLIAVHRFVILGEVADRPIWIVPATYRRFVGWLLLLSVVWLPAAAIQALTGLLHPLLNALISFLFLTFAMVVILRLMLLLPALAVATPAANWRNAWNDSRGHAWKFLGAQLLSCLPWMVIATTIVVWFRGVRPPGNGILLLAAAGSSASNLFTSYLAAVVASRLFQGYGVALNQRSGSGAFRVQ
jgi:hypothetical protein